MARKLIVEIIGDSSSLDKALGRATTSTTRFGVGLGGLVKGGLAVGAGLGIASGGVDLLFTALKGSIRAAQDAEKANALVGQAFKNAGLSAKTYSKELDNAGASAIKLGFDDEAAQVSLARFVTAGQSVAQSMRDVTIAEDLARLKNISLEASTQILITAASGQTRALRTLGLAYVPTTKAVDALREAHKKSKEPITAAELATAKLADKQQNAAAVMNMVSKATEGQAAAFSRTSAGGMAVFAAQVDNLKERLGNELLPVMQGIVTWINANWGTIGAVVTEVFRVVNVAVQTAITPMRVLWDLLHGDWAGAWNALKAPAEAAWSAIKGAIQPVIDLIRGPLTTALSAIQTLAGTVWSAVSGAVTTAIATVTSTITGAITGAFNDAKRLGSRIVAGIADGLTGIAATVSSAIRGGVSAIGGFFTEGFNKASALGGRVVSGIGSGLADAAGAVTGAISSAIGAIGKFFTSAFDKGKALGDKIVDGLRYILNAIKIPGMHISIPYPTISIGEGHVSVLGVDIPYPKVNFGIGWKGFDIPGFDPIPEFAAGGPVPIIAHAGEYVIRSDSAKRLGLNMLNYINAVGRLPRYQEGGVINPWQPGLTEEQAARAASMAQYGRTTSAPGRAMAMLRDQINSMYPDTFTWDESRNWPWRLRQISNGGRDWGALLGILNQSAWQNQQRITPSIIDRKTQAAIRTLADPYPGDFGSLLSGIPKLAAGGRLLSDGFYYGHRGETVTPATVAQGGGTIHNYVVLDGKVVGESVQDYLITAGRFGGPGIKPFGR